VQDVAAATGAPVDAVAAAVGSLHQALQSGNGVEQAAEQLQQMGAISETTAQKVAAMSAAGVALSGSWSAVSSDLNKAAGAAKELGDTLSGIQGQIDAIKQASDTKLGNMFEEGAKAAKRGEKGFQELSAKIQEANAGPWAAFNEVVGKVKESIGNLAGALASTGAVQSVFNAIAEVSVSVLSALYISLLAAVPMLLRFATITGGVAVGALSRLAAAAGISTTAIRGMAVALTGLAFNPLTVALTLAAGLFVNLAGKAIAASRSVEQFNQKMKESRASRGDATGKVLSESQTARTPEERDAAEKNANQAIAESKQRVSENNKTIEQSDKILNSTTLGISDYSMPERDAAASNKATAEKANAEEAKAQQSFQDQINGLAQRTVGFDQERLKIAQERLALERQIANEATKALQKSMNPKSAKEAADNDVAEAERNLKKAEFASKNSFEEKSKLTKAGAAFKETVDENDAAQEKIKEGSAEKLLSKAPASQKYEVEKAIKENDFKELDRQVAMGALSQGDVDEYRQGVQAKADRKPLDYSVFDTEAQTDSGKIQAEIAKREAMVAEEKSALNAKDAFGNSAPDKERVRAVREKMGELVNPLTGASEFAGDKKMQDLQSDVQVAQADYDDARKRGLGDNRVSYLERKMNSAKDAVGEYAAGGIAIPNQRLTTDLQTAQGGENEATRRKEFEAALDTQNVANVAVASEDASMEAGKRKLDAERSSAALRGSGAGADVQAQAEIGPEVDQLNKKLAALKKLEAAEKALNAAVKERQEAKEGTSEYKAAAAKESVARDGVRSAEVAAAGAGAQQGDTAASMQAELDAANQILAISIQQASIDEAAANSRKNAAMEELRLRQQLLQLNLDNATGVTGTKDSASQKEIDKEQAKADKYQQSLNATETVARLDKQIEGLETQVSENPEDQEAKEKLAMAKKSRAHFNDQRYYTDPPEDLIKLRDNALQNVKDLKSKPQNEADIQIASEKEKEDRAAGIADSVERREALVQKSKDNKGKLSEKDQSELNELNTKIAEAGFDENTKSKDIENAITTSQGNQMQIKTEQIAANKKIIQDAEIKSLSMQEKYAPNREASEAAKTRREELEDEAKVESKTAQYSETMEAGKARDLAEKETELERVGIRAEETGQARVDSLTAVGGGATGFIGANQDPAKKTADLAAQIKSILDSVTTKLDNQTSEAQRLAQEMREAAK
jgi:hypothetical protein